MVMRRFRNDLWDGLLALALLAIGLGGTAPAAQNQGVGQVGRWASVFVVVAAVAVAVRRRLPVPVLAVVTGAVAVYLLGGYPAGPILISLAVALYTVAASRPLRVAAVAAG